MKPMPVPFVCGQLFGLLRSLGFSKDDSVEGRIVFEHAKTGAILMCRAVQPGDEISGADLLSSDVHLTGRGLIEKPLELLLSEAKVQR